MKGKSFEPKVGIVIVNYNGLMVLNDCITSLEKIDYSNYQIVVVDNDSKDDSISLLKKFHPQVEVIENKENLGVAEGNNIGIKYALKKKAAYILLLNPDTEVKKNFLTKLVKTAKKNKKALICPKIYYFSQPKILWYAGGYMNWFSGTSFHTGQDKKDVGQYQETKKVDYSSTCCLLIPAYAFGEIGMMDKKYFVYFDDTDFCARANKKDFSIIYYPKAVIWHKVGSLTGGETSPIAIYYGTRNKLYFMKKNASFLRFYLFLPIFYLIRMSKIVRFLLKGDFKKIKLIFKAIKDYYQNKLGYQKI